MTSESRAEERLWHDLRGVFDAVDPVPADVLAVARGALALRTLDAELARLVADSALDLSVGVRDDGPGRLVTFESDTLTIEVQVSQTGADRHLVGQLVPPVPARVTIQTPGGAVEVDADELGRFSASQVPAGPVRLVCHRPSEQVTVTSWLTI